MRFLSIVVAMITVAAGLAAAPAYAQTCQQLWVERNQYYKNHGYCFKTQTAVDYFGIVGCTILDQDAVPITRSEKAYILQIVAREKALRCPLIPTFAGQIEPTPADKNLNSQGPTTTVPKSSIPIVPLKPCPSALGC